MARRLLLLAAAAAALALPAPAAPAGDKDGASDPAETAAGLKRILGSFKVLDADGDGKLSEKELPDLELIKALDADHDGAVSREEILRALKSLPAPAPGGEKKPGEPGPGKPGMDKPADGETFAAYAKRRLASDPRFNAEARRTQFLANFDNNPKDGRIQRKEYAGAEADKVFRDFDRDRDGTLDEKELLLMMKEQIDDLEKSRRHPTRANFLLLYDIDEDRRVTREEYSYLRGPASAFQSYDEDGDGVVTYDELFYANGNSKDRRYKGKEGGPAAAAPPPEKRDVWELYDKDHDGRVTLEEFGGGEAVFRRLDRNRDGVLTAADL
jgi:Ca2+-binding EF-hand superfamily protein